MKCLFDLSGNVAVIAGTRTGLGQGMSLGLAEAGAKYNSRCKAIMQEASFYIDITL
jgi:NAD(P)-dependent dehydrogenase (short-subunit alcohol dehydrogenase family)